MKRLALVPGATLALACLLLAWPLWAQDADDVEPRDLDASDLVNSLLSGLMGFEDATGEELQKQVEDVGGVGFRSNVPLDYLDRKALAGYLKELFDDEYPASRASADARTLTAFDLLPAGTDLRALRERLLLQNVAGFYDERPGKKRLYAVSSERRLTPANQMILAHELRHALQDQYADIHGILPDSVGDFDDRRIAMLSLFEGDATLLMQRFLLRRIPGGEEAGLEDATLPVPPVEGAPPVVRDQLVRPYTDGLNLAQVLYRNGGWSGLRDAWSRPPASMEQVLHPEKYLSREEPRATGIPYSAAGGRLLSEGVLGEMLAGTLIDQEAPSAATEGWGGDLFRVWDVAGRTLLVWRSVWDGPRDMAEYRDALLTRFRAAHGAGIPEGDFTVFTAGSWRFGVGDGWGALLFIASDDKAAFDAAATAFKHS
jgi:hypothetical protein